MAREREFSTGIYSSENAEHLDGLAVNEAASPQAAAEHLEYLKNCLVQYMSVDASSRATLWPVIATLMKFSPSEREQVAKAAKSEVDGGWASSLFAAFVIC